MKEVVGTRRLIERALYVAGAGWGIGQLGGARCAVMIPLMF